MTQVLRTEKSCKFFHKNPSTDAQKHSFMKRMASELVSRERELLENKYSGE